MGKIYFDKPRRRRRFAVATALVAILIVINIAPAAPKKAPPPASTQPANSPWRQSPFGWILLLAAAHALLARRRRAEVIGERDACWRKPVAGAQRVRSFAGASRVHGLGHIAVIQMPETSRHRRPVSGYCRHRASRRASGRIAEPRAPHADVLANAQIPHVSIHGLRRTFSLLGEAAGTPAGAIAKVMGHKPSAIAEGYRPRSIDALRPYLEQIERFILDRAGVPFDAAQPGRCNW